MRLGFSSMNTPEDLAPDRLAIALEERGYDSLWIGEHSHIPVSRQTPYPSGGDMPDQYRRMMDPFASLLVAATATTTLLVGTGVALPLERDLLEMAKLITTVDRLSGGRLQYGVGVGWNEEELANHRSVPWRERYRALAECIAALKTLWCDEESEFHGQYYDFEPVWSLPKPLQQPHPPIWCGTGGKLGTQHALSWADGWMPMDVALGDVPRKLGRFRAMAADAGREGIPITIVAFGDPTRETLELYRSLDVERVVLGASRSGWDDPGTTMPFIDRYAPMIDMLA